MWTLGPVGFATPWLLIALVALPVLWLILRTVPPAPVRRLFPGVILLKGLEDRDAESARTPWWLLALRLLALAAMIVGFAGPVLNPEPVGDGGPERPLVVFVEDGWPAAPDWSARLQAAEQALEAARREGRQAALVLASAPRLELLAADAWLARLPGLAPVPWLPEAGTGWLDGLEAADFLWISDGLARPERAGLLARFEALGRLEIVQSPAARLALLPVAYDEEKLVLTALRSQDDGMARLAVGAFGPDPSGIERQLARAQFTFAAASNEARVELVLPPELRNRITRFALEDIHSAGAVSLSDDSLQRRRVGVVVPGAGREGLELLAPDHYLRHALETSVELVDGSPAQLVRAGADVIILADIANLGEADRAALTGWVEAGGLLVRFAGPRLASADTGRGVEDALLPVRLRAGGRVVGGAMSWGAPRALAPFPEGSPFQGLKIPDEVAVSAQVLAEPGPELSARTIAALADGTPLVTRKSMGEGHVVLFHVTANAEWSGLPLSGLFVQMLDRLAISTRAIAGSEAALEGTEWVATHLLDGFGALSPRADLPAVPGPRLALGAGEDLPPGLYASQSRQRAVNAAGAQLAGAFATADWPARIVPEWGGEGRARELAGWFWLAALVALGLDILAALALTGRMPAMGRAAPVFVALGLGFGLADGARAQTQAGDGESAVVAAAAQVTLAHVLTGDREVDALAHAGLVGLSDALFRRTSIEPASPVGVDLESDALGVYPLLYWPITERQALPSAAAYARLNTYLHTGGMVLFDTRDGDIAAYGAGATAAGARLRLLAAPLDIPALEPVPDDHVLTRSFYLLSDYPGRHAGTPVWVEASSAAAERAEGMPFRNLNDGVSPVVIGGNDWAAAWAVDGRGAPLVPVGRGSAGERQREMAYRFGINLVMHVLTGNYKSDQVHVPALLERLGQ